MTMRKLPALVLVDDDDTTNFLHERLFTTMAVTDQVIVAVNGAEALAVLPQALGAVSSADHPALVLLDLNMPVMGGIEFLEAYQRLPLAQQQAARVVVLTTSMSSRDLGRVEDLPIAGLATKPLTREKIATILQLHFQHLAPAA